MEDGVLPGKFKRKNDEAGLRSLCEDLRGTLEQGGVTEKGELFELSPEGFARVGVNAALSSHFRSDRCAARKRLKGECLVWCSHTLTSLCVGAEGLQQATPGHGARVRGCGGGGLRWWGHW